MSSSTGELEGVSRRQMATAIIASLLGWSLDLFDLFILLYVAPIIGKLFFPSDVPTLSLAAVYASFAVTVLMRPVGSALFGPFADLHGRKGAMIVAVIGVGVTTASLGALPTIEQVGMLAPVLFLMLRLVQGIFVGGVVAATHTIGTESVPVHWRGALSGLVGVGGAGIGGVLASIVYLITAEIFPGDQFAVWGWRVMFFSGILSAVLGVFVFASLEESPVWAALKRRAAAAGTVTVAAPLRTMFSKPWRGLLVANVLLCIGGGGGYYITSGYLPTFLKLVSKVPNRDASLILIGCNLVAIAASLIMGHLSTFWGRRRVFIITGLLRLVLLPLCYFAMARAGGDIWQLVMYAVVLVFLANGSFAPLLIYLNERYPTAMRSTGTGVSGNIGFAIGGMMPTFVSLASPTTQDLPAGLAWFSVGLAAVFLLGAFISPETNRDLG